MEFAWRGCEVRPSPARDDEGALLPLPRRFQRALEVYLSVWGRWPSAKLSVALTMVVNSLAESSFFKTVRPAMAHQKV